MIKIVCYGAGMKPGDIVKVRKIPGIFWEVEIISIDGPVIVGKLVGGTLIPPENVGDKVEFFASQVSLP